MEVPKHMKLSDLTRRIEDQIKLSFGTQLYWIVAEISSHKFYPDNDRHYFQFVEKIEGSNTETAKISGKAWTSGSLSIKEFEKVTGQRFTNSIQVLAQVQVEFHSIHGFSLILKSIDPSFTLGNLEKQRRETLARLLAENPDHIYQEDEEYITRNKEIDLKPVLQRIALIASPKSDGYNDFVHTLVNNQYGYKFNVDEYHSSVQGAFAERELTDAMMNIFQSKIDYDAVVIVRGGGSSTDFLVFDTYSLSRIVARFPIPVITGIGHLKDISIVDMMAHTSTKTPTKAAEFIVAQNRSFEESILALQKTVIIQSQQTLRDAYQSINSTNNNIINTTRDYLSKYQEGLVSIKQTVMNSSKNILYNNKADLVSMLNQLLSKPSMMVSNKRSELNHTKTNLQIFTNKLITNQRGYLGHYTTLVKMMSPQNILKKGFALVSVDGKIVKDAKGIKTGDHINISMADAKLTTEVTSKTKNDG
jgi:exodeoxyribonuclease VII large subunit